IRKGGDMGKDKRKQRSPMAEAPIPEHERRVFCRFSLKDVPVRLKDLKAGGHGEALCQDISGSGAGLSSEREVRPKTPLEMWFDLPDDFEPMHLLGKVAWARHDDDHWHIGVSFDRQRLLSLARILKLEG
ncbi:MAG: PilZ domain-containing protein, partial [Deltaproteobacteria bacterium]